MIVPGVSPHARPAPGASSARDTVGIGMPRKKPDRPWRWVDREGGARVLDENRWQQYAGRLRQLLALHHHAYVPAIFAFAALSSGIDPWTFVEWATDERLFDVHRPERPELAGALADVRRAFLARRPERDDYSARDLLEEHVVFVPEVTASYNWAPYHAEARAAVRKRAGSFDDCRNVELPPGERPALPVGLPAFVTLRIPVGHLNQWDLGDLVEAMREVLSDAMRECPTRTEALRMRGAIPAERTFLVHCREEEFQRDLERYRLSQTRGLGNVQIAYLEWARIKGRSVDTEANPPTIDGAPIPDTIQESVPGQSSISESLKRIHEALYLETAPSADLRRRIARVELPAYNCPIHGQTCFIDSDGENATDRRDRTCSYLRSWSARLIANEVLDSDERGRLSGQVEYREEADEDQTETKEPGDDLPGRPLENGARSSAVTILRFALAELPDRFRTVLQSLHGIDCEPLTRDEVARRVGLTPKQVDKLAEEASEMVRHQVRLLS
jgi:DNA-directed RNA polymerase specialized sigma24 family protein